MICIFSNAGKQIRINQRSSFLKFCSFHLGLILRWKYPRVSNSPSFTKISFFGTSGSTFATPKKDDTKTIIENISKENIRNFSIVAHIDHGKSTLSDRLLEFTGTISKATKNEQVLDKLQVERERGITVKAQTVSMLYTYKDQNYLLNLIDTPGHVDFSYEVARSLAACQGAVLLVDANQGVQAQTVANFNLAFFQDLTIVTALNKIDLKNAKPEAVALQVQRLFDVELADIIKVSAKFGTGIQELLEAVIDRIPPPPGDSSKPFRGLLFDSWYDKYRGVISLVAVVDGRVAVGDEIVSSFTGQSYIVRELGVLHPEETPLHHLSTGQAGYVVANIRTIAEAKLGDTLFHKGAPIEALPALEMSKPMVFAGIFPVDQSQNQPLRSAVEKLCLNDPSVSVEIDSSPALGQGWRLGFLGLLHMEVFSQRLELEFDAPVVVTSPSVPYKVRLKGAKQIKLYQAEEIIISNPLKLPDRSAVSEYFEPVVNATIIMPATYFGTVTSLCMERRGLQRNISHIDNDTMMLQYKFPLCEVIVDFFDQLKSISSGYASFDYEDAGYESTDIVKMDILLNGKVVEEMATIVHASRAQKMGRQFCLKLQEVIPQQLFLIAIQAVIGGKVIARENIKAIKKNVLAKCYGGDVTRKMKLLKRQAEGKAKMRLVGNVEVPREAFIKVLKK